MRDKNSIVVEIILFVFVLLLFWFFMFSPLINHVFAEGIEVVEDAEDVEVVEVVETVEHVITLEYPDEPVEVLSSDYRPSAHFSGIPYDVGLNMVDGINERSSYLLNSLADGIYDYVLYYNTTDELYELIVFNPDEFNNLGGFYFVGSSNNFGVSGVVYEGGNSERRPLQNPITVRFEPSAGELVSYSEPGDSYLTNRTYFPGYLLFTSLTPSGAPTGIPSSSYVAPKVGQYGYEWTPVIERYILLKEGVEMYEVERYALFLFIAVGYIIVNAFRFGYFSRNY